MTMLRKFCALLVLAFSLTGIAHAEQKITVGNYDIHYNAVSTTFFAPKTAKTYNIKRSKNVGFINISIIDTKQKGNPGVSVDISGTRKNLMDVKVPIKFREVKEGKAVYYIAEIPHSGKEKYHFDIKIKHGNDLNTSLTFDKTFYD